MHVYKKKNKNKKNRVVFKTIFEYENVQICFFYLPIIIIKHKHVQYIRA